MFTCAICHFAVPGGAVAVTGPRAQCVCLRCYLHVTGSAKP
jgi:hypothetical protein